MKLQQAIQPKTTNQNKQSKQAFQTSIPNNSNTQSLDVCLFRFLFSLLQPSACWTSSIIRPGTDTSTLAGDGDGALRALSLPSGVVNIWGWSWLIALCMFVFPFLCSFACLMALLIACLIAGLIVRGPHELCTHSPSHNNTSLSGRFCSLQVCLQLTWLERSTLHPQSQRWDSKHPCLFSMFGLSDLFFFFFGVICAWVLCACLVQIKFKSLNL